MIFFNFIFIKELAIGQTFQASVNIIQDKNVQYSSCQSYLIKSFKCLDKNLCMTYCTATVGCQVAVYDTQSICSFYSSLFVISDSNNLVDSAGTTIFYLSSSSQTYPKFNGILKSTFNAYQDCLTGGCSIASITVTKKLLVLRIRQQSYHRYKSI